MATFITPVNITPGVRGSWVDVDVSSHVPPGATGVILHTYFNASSSDVLAFRNNGSTDTYLGKTFESHTWHYIGIDSNRIFEARIDNIANATVWLVGYFTSEAVFFVNAVNKSLSSSNTWKDVDISSDTGTDTAIGAIIEAYNSYYTEYSFGCRKNGSTDNRTNVFYYTVNTGVIIGVDANEIFEAYVGSYSRIYILLVGYLKSGAVFHTNAPDISLSTSGSWIDLPALPSGALGGIIEIVATNRRPYALRKNGSTEDIYYYVANHFWATVECDENGVIEGKIADTNVDFFLAGYLVTPSFDTAFSAIPASGMGQVSAENIDTATGLAVNPALSGGMTLPGKFASDALLNITAALGAGIPPAGMSLLNTLYLPSALGFNASAPAELNIIADLQSAPSPGVGFLVSPEIAIAASLGILPVVGIGFSPAGLLLDSSLSITPALGTVQAAIGNFTADATVAALVNLGIGAALTLGATSEAILNAAPILDLGHSPIAIISDATNLLALSALGAGLAETTGIIYGISVPMISSLGAGAALPHGAAISAVLNAIPVLGSGQSIDALMDSTLSILTSLGMNVMPRPDMSAIVNLAAAPSSGAGSTLIADITIDAYLKALAALGAGTSFWTRSDISADFNMVPALGGGILGAGRFASAVNLAALFALGLGASPNEAALISAFPVLSATGAGQAPLQDISATVNLAAIASQGLGISLPGVFEADTGLALIPAIGTAITPGDLSLLGVLPITSALGIGSSLQAESDISAAFGVGSAQGLGVAIQEGLVINAILTAHPASGVGFALVSKASGAVGLFAASAMLGMGYPLPAKASIAASLQGLSVQASGIAQRAGVDIISVLPGILMSGNGLIAPARVASVVNLQTLSSVGTGIILPGNPLNAVNLTSAPAFSLGKTSLAELKTVTLFPAPATLAQSLALPAGMESGFKFGAISALMSGQAMVPEADIYAAFETPGVISLGLTPSGLTVILPYYSTFVRDLKDPIIVRLLKDPIVIRILK